MGEIIKYLHKADKRLELDIELNKPNSEGEPEMVHLQSSFGRVQFTKEEFLKLSAAILAANKELSILKEGLDHE